MAYGPSQIVTHRTRAVSDAYRQYAHAATLLVIALSAHGQPRLTKTGVLIRTSVTPSDFVLRHLAVPAH